MLQGEFAGQRVESCGVAIDAGEPPGRECVRHGEAVGPDVSTITNEATDTDVVELDADDALQTAGPGPVRDGSTRARASKACMRAIDRIDRVRHDAGDVFGSVRWR